MYQSPQLVKNRLANQVSFLVLSGVICFSGLIGGMHHHENVGVASGIASASPSCSCTSHSDSDAAEDGTNPSVPGDEEECLFCKILAEHHLTVPPSFEFEQCSVVAEFFADPTSGLVQINALSPKSRGPPAV